MKYRPEIDGLRSFAVLPVILFHAGVAPFSGGFVGVDVFFVISGYLITTIILGEMLEGRFTISGFYVRRARRILPALVFVILCTLPFAWAWLPPPAFTDFAQSLAAIGLFSSNVLFWMESGYFAADADLKPLLHTWSLAVEEQFYVFFPLLMMLLVRRGAGLGRAVGAIIGIGAASLVLCEILWRTEPDANFYLLPSRAWELLAGALCAAIMLRARPEPNRALAAAGLALILIATFAYDGATPFPSLWALVPVAGSALVILYATPDGPAGRILASRPAVWIGLLSYSAYLWHQPIFALVRIRMGEEPSEAVMLGLSALTFALAWFSWRFVERPFRRPGGSKALVLGAAAAVSVGAAGFGAWLSVSPLQRSWFYDNLRPDQRQVLAVVERVQARDQAAPWDDGACRFRVRPDRPEDVARFEACAADGRKALAVFGDSHSDNVHEGLSRTLSHPFVVHVPQGECRPAEDQDLHPCAGSALETFLLAQRGRIGAALYSQAGFWILRDGDGAPGSRGMFYEAVVEGAPDRAKIRAVRGFLDGLRAQGVAVSWIGPRWAPHIRPKRLVELDCREAETRLHVKEGAAALFAALDQAAAEEMAGAATPYISEQKIIRMVPGRDVYSCDRLFWADTDHWSADGAARFGARLAEGLRAAGTLDGL